MHIAAPRDPSAGILDEATATKRSRDAHVQRVHDARESQLMTTLTPVPAPRSKPLSASAKPANKAHVDTASLIATTCLTHSRSWACTLWLYLARAHDRVRTRRLVFENELKSEPYKPTQE
eukprot:1777506-Pleurochrysis_carterae.AAC.1